MKRVEKIDVRSAQFGGDGRRYLKRRTARLIRRAGKRSPEDAPRAVRQVTRGWVS